MHDKRLLKENFVPLLQNDQAAKNYLRLESAPKSKSHPNRVIRDISDSNILI